MQGLAHNLGTSDIDKQQENSETIVKTNNLIKLASYVVCIPSVVLFLVHLTQNKNMTQVWYEMIDTRSINNKKTLNQSSIKQNFYN